MDWKKYMTKWKSKWIILLIQLVMVMGTLTIPVKGQNEEKPSLISTLADIKVNKDVAKSVTLNKTISLKVENVSLIQALNEVAEKANLKIAYNESFIESLDQKKITLDLSQITVHDALWKLLNGTNLRYAISSNRNLVLTKSLDEKPYSPPAYQEIITGQVTDASTGEPLPGVNILLQGTSTGAATNEDGQFELSVTSLDGTLVFSFIGYQSKKVPIAGKTEIDVEMQPEALIGEELMVTAFGLEREQKSLTYSTESVRVEEMTEARELNVVNSLQGKVAGLTISSSGSGVGSPSRVVLRGNTSFTGNNQPLYVVDGVAIRGNPADLNSDNISSVSVLHGPNAAALYGSRAQNGVILINTKRGTSGQVDISTNSTFMIDRHHNLFEFQNEFGQGVDGVYNPNSEFSWGPRMEGQMVQHWSPDPERAGETYSFLPQPDNFNNFLQTGYNLANNLTASIGGQSTQSVFSYTHTDARGVVPNNELVRQNASVRITSQLSSDLTLDSKIEYIRQNISNQIPQDRTPTNPMVTAYRLPRNISTSDMKIFEYTDEDGQNRQHYWFPGSNGQGNPYWTVNRALNENFRERVIALASLNYDFTDYLGLMGRISYDGEHNEREEKCYNDTYISCQDGLYSFQKGRSMEWNGDLLLSFEQDFMNYWNISMNIGGNYQQQRNNSLSANTGPAMSIPNFFTLPNSQDVRANQNFGESIDVGSVYSFGEIGYQNSIFLDFTARNDWSSTLSSENRSYFYPSIGLSAVLSDLIPAFPEFFTFAKIRGSFAKVGNHAPPYMLSRFALFDQGGTDGFIQLDPVLPHEDLKPEETKSYEVGLDLRLFDDRLGFDITGYKMNTINQLFTVTLPVGSGATSFFTNGGDVENIGVGILMSTRPIQTEDISWDLNFRYAKNQNTVLDVHGDSDRLIIGGDFQMRENVVAAGEPYGQVYTRGWVRDDQGRVIVQDNGMPMVTAGRSVPTANFQPDWTGSISSTFTFQNFSASILIDHRQGGTVASFTNAINFADGVAKETLQGRDGGLIFGDNFFSNETAVDENGQPNTVTIDAATFWRTVGGRNVPIGEAFIEDATNTRLRELSIGYSISNKILERLPFSNVKVSLVGRNLFFLYRASDNLDPDRMVGTGNAAEGFDAFGPPTTRSYGLNLKINY